jgi:hypothetical protein
MTRFLKGTGIPLGCLLQTFERGQGRDWPAQVTFTDREQKKGLRVIGLQLQSRVRRRARRADPALFQEPGSLL